MAVVFSVVIWVLLCILVGKCAERWNRSFGKYLILSIIISPLIMGIILLIMGKNMIKAESSNKNESYSDKEEKKVIDSSNRFTVWKECPRCHKNIDANLTGCPHCGNNSFPEIKNNEGGTITCKRCKKKVDAGYRGCPYCGGSDFE